MTGIALFAGLWAVIIAAWVLIWRDGRRTLRRMDESAAADRRRWALQDQLRQVEEQIREEHLSDEERE